MSIIDSTYKLCNYLRKTEYSNNLKTLVNDLNKSNTSDISSGNFGYVARHHTIQFLSYLYVNENYIKMNDIMVHMNMSPLNEHQKLMFEKGHNFLLQINNLIKNQLLLILPNAADVLDMYNKTKIKLSSNESIDIPYTYIEDLVKEFFNHRSFQIIRKAVNEFPKLLELPKDKILLGVEVLRKDLTLADFFEVPTSVKEMENILPRAHIGQNINRVFRSLVCLKTSVMIFNQLIYQACKQEKLTVLDNSNVSNIIRQKQFYLGDGIIIEVQPNDKCNTLILPRSCCYLNIVVNESYVVKGLFWLINHSFSMNAEYGYTEKYWLKRIDDDLNYFIKFNRY